MKLNQVGTKKNGEQANQKFQIEIPLFNNREEKRKSEKNYCEIISFHVRSVLPEKEVFLNANRFSFGL